jgi:hypothetical protein
VEGGGDEELWLFKRPIEIRQSGTSPFFEGEAELQNVPNITPVCAYYPLALTVTPFQFFIIPVVVIIFNSGVTLVTPIVVDLGLLYVNIYQNLRAHTASASQP